MSKNTTETVKVAVRCRPLSPKEVKDQRKSIVEVKPDRGEIIVRNPKGDPSESPKIFTFDYVYGPDALQKNIYDESAFSIVESVLEGYNGTIFAYGQTGTGKTFTMEGYQDNPQHLGIIPRAFSHIFQYINSTAGSQYLVRVSFLEIYNEEIRDLLAKNVKNRLKLREKPNVGVYAEGLGSAMVQNEQEMLSKLEQGRKSRATGATAMNPGSSRSHSIFTITIEASADAPDGKNHIRVGKLNLVDLAGSERFKKTQAVGERLEEGININQSLSVLGNVISALTDPKATHIPYRNSQLTWLLQDSLGGNTKTIMIANVGPTDWNFDETLSTLRYANRAKSIKNKPKINDDPKDAMLREFQDEILKLKEQLALAAEGFGPGLSVVQQGNKKVIEKIVKVDDEKKIKEMEQKLAAEREELARRVEEERKQIEEQKNLAEVEKIRLLKELQEREEAENKARETQEHLLKKLKKMEEKLLVGNKAMEQASKQQKALAIAKKELEDIKMNEKRLAVEMASREDEYLLYEKKFGDASEELEDKRKNLQKIYEKFHQAKYELQDQTNEIRREREVYIEQIRNLTKLLMLKMLKLESFIPGEEIERIETKALWDDELDNWVIPNRELGGNMSGKRGRLSGEKSASPKDVVEGNIAREIDLRRQFESQHNVYFVYTDEGPELQDEQSTIERNTETKTGLKKPESGKKRPPSASKTTVKKESEENFPKSRGLVKTNLKK